MELEKLFSEYAACRQEHDRLSWDDFFLGVAFLVSKRSHDAQTQCGAVIVNEHNEIVSTGYNGFIRGIDDKVLPNLRPDKYSYMIHAEHNAVLSCSRDNKSCLGCKMYVTGPPCGSCIQVTWQSGISTVIHGQNTSNMAEGNRCKTYNTIKFLTGIKVIEKKFDPKEFFTKLGQLF